MWSKLSDPQGIVGFDPIIYPHSSALRASNGGYNKSDLLAEVLSIDNPLKTIWSDHSKNEWFDQPPHSVQHSQKRRQERIRVISYTLLLRYIEEGVTIDTLLQKFLDQ
ncbi:hypothetical protein HMPREF3027_05615 [Porphyromonas sp. HMSC077F02]|nr:hypothetical protein HMPREF3027_05615 [Porphyromonas sp. HMSC077F02]